MQAVTAIARNRFKSVTPPQMAQPGSPKKSPVAIRFSGEKLDEFVRSKRKLHQDAGEDDRQLKSALEEKVFSQGHKESALWLINQTHVTEMVGEKKFQFSGWELLEDLDKDPEKELIVSKFNEMNQLKINRFFDALVDLKVLKRQQSSKSEHVMGEDESRSFAGLYFATAAGHRLDVATKQFVKSV